MQLRSVCCRPIRTGELTLPAINPTFELAAESALNVGELVGSGRSRCLVAVWRCERPVTAGAAGPIRPRAVLRALELRAGKPSLNEYRGYTNFSGALGSLAACPKD